MLSSLTSPAFSSLGLSRSVALCSGSLASLPHVVSIRFVHISAAMLSLKPLVVRELDFLL